MHFHASNSTLRTLGYKPVRGLLLTLVLAIAAVAIAPATASAFDVTNFSVTSDTMQAAAHPNLKVSFDRNGGQSEDLKDAVINTPPGVLFDPEATPSKCSYTYFNRDRCLDSQQVGTISTDVTALGLLPLNNVNGGVYQLEADGNDTTTLGYALRPIGSQLRVLNKMYVKDHLVMRTWSDYGIENSHFNLPRYATAVLILSVPITIEHMEVLLQSRAGKYKNGNYFMINSSSCAAVPAELAGTSYQNVTRTRTSPYTSTGCENVSADASFSQSVTNNTANGFTGGPIVVAQDRSPMAIQRSTVKDVEVSFPQGTSLNFDLLGTLTGCSAAQFDADTCPAGSKIGTTQAVVPYMPPAFTGDVYAMDPIGSTLHLGMIIRGVRNIKARFVGRASVVGQGTDQRLVATVSNAPQVPWASFSLNFTQPVLRNPDTCGSQTVTAKITGHSGDQVTKTSTYNTINCPPDTTIDTGPPSPTNDNTPTFTFSASLAGSSFKCATDGASFSTCTTPTTVSPALSDGEHLFRVQACLPGNPSICDVTPAEYTFVVDTAAPSLSITSPSEGATVGTNVSTQFTAETGVGLTCKIDSTGGPGSFVACDSDTSHSFNGVPDGAATITVRATDAAGNTTDGTVNVVVSGVACPGCSDTAITDGPDNGLKVTKRNPTYTFESTPNGAPAFECQVDGGVWAACSSPYAIPQVPNVAATHSFCVRAIADLGDIPGSTDPTPDCASFEWVVFSPSLTATYLDNTNNALPDTKAASHPDVEFSVSLPGGQMDSATFELPNGFWGSLAAAPLCSQANVAAGACPIASKIGTAQMSVRKNDNTPLTFTSNMYLAASTTGNIANVAFDMPVLDGSNDYGSLRDNAQLGFTARYVLGVGEVTNVRNPRGMNTATVNFPAFSTGPAGTLNFHVQNLAMHFDGDVGGGTGNWLLTSPSNCGALSTRGIIRDKEYNVVPSGEKGQHTKTITLPYNATDCGTVPFSPDLSIAFAPAGLSGGGETNASAVASLTLPPNNSTIKAAELTVPYSIQPQYDGLVDACYPADTKLEPPTCNEPETLVGSATIDTPLLLAPLTGKVYLEDSGAALPNLYIYIRDVALGLNVRLRAASRTTDPEVAPGSQVQFVMNALENGNQVDLPDIPINSLVLSLPGTAVNGPIAKLSGDCYTHDESATGTITGWSGAANPYSDPKDFTTPTWPACPNASFP